MTGRRCPPHRRLPGASPPAAFTPPEAQVGQVPALLRAAANVVAAAAGGGSSQAPVVPPTPRLTASGAAGTSLAAFGAASAASAVSSAADPSLLVAAAALVCVGAPVALPVDGAVCVIGSGFGASATPVADVGITSGVPAPAVLVHAVLGGSPASGAAAVSASSLGAGPQRHRPLPPHVLPQVPRFRHRSPSPGLPGDALDPPEGWWLERDSWTASVEPGSSMGRWAADTSIVADIVRWERRLLDVGECLALLATVLNQLHAGLQSRPIAARDPQLDEMQQCVVRAAAAQCLWSLLHLPLKSESPAENEGPGATCFRWVATAAEEAPLGLVPALALVLRWLRWRIYLLNLL
ncbi:unnamed protein product [Closterium sp. Naga37s-1]|nr:unnamed protein product [Closterium sp. Naga37s-1]